MKSHADVFNEGIQILASVMEPCGFEFCLKQTGKSSGGIFSYGEWQKQNRKLELHFRYSLGLVAYHFGTDNIDHNSFIWAVTGKRHVGMYPGHSNVPLDGFRNLRDDLEKYGEVFLEGKDKDLSALMKHAQQLDAKWHKLSPFQRLEIE